MSAWHSDAEHNTVIEIPTVCPSVCLSCTGIALQEGQLPQTCRKPVEILSTAAQLYEKSHFNDLKGCLGSLE